MAVNPLQSFIWGAGGAALTPEEVAQQRLMETRALAKGIDTSPVGHWSQGAARVADAIAGAVRRGRLDKAGEANAAYDADLLSSISGGAYPSSVAAGGSTFAPAATGVESGISSGSADISPEIRDGIVQTAQSIGIDPVDLATAISYETGGTFNPTQGGPTTKYGKHRGFIQFGEPQAEQYGVDWNNPIGSQLGPDGAVAKYLVGSGVKPGMGLLDIYSAINAGAPGLYNRSDAKAGGAPGTVRDKVEQQMSGHRAKALALFGSQQQAPAASAINAIAPVQVASLEPGAGMAEVAPMPAVTPTMRDAAVAEVTQPQPAPIMAMAPEEVVTPVGVGGAPAGSGGRPILDVTQMPTLSAAAGLPVEQSGAPIAAAINQPSVSPAVQQVAAALPIRAQADPNDVMVAGRDQTVQPEGYFPPAPSMSPAQGQPNAQALIRAMTDPRASPQTRAVAEVLYKQQAQQAAAQAEQQQWQARQQYEAQQQSSDPKRQLEIKKLEQEVNGEKKQPLVNVGNGVLYDPNSSEWLTAPGQEEKVPESVRALEIRADRAGLVKGTPEYNQFMLSGGQKGTSLSIGPDGTVQFNEGVGVSGKPLTESQSKLTLFQSLQTETQPVLLDLETQFNPANLPDAAARSAPIAGNFFKSEQGQIYDAAATAWAEGALRIATGAAATPEEMERTKRAYFAQPGDTPNTISFKAQMREMYNRSIDRSLGKKSEGALPKPGDFAKTVKSTIGDGDDDGLTRPESVPESDWKYMTPEEQRLFVK